MLNRELCFRCMMELAIEAHNYSFLTIWDGETNKLRREERWQNDGFDCQSRQVGDWRKFSNINQNTTKPPSKCRYFLEQTLWCESRAQ